MSITHKPSMWNFVFFVLGPLSAVHLEHRDQKKKCCCESETDLETGPQKMRVRRR